MVQTMLDREGFYEGLRGIPAIECVFASKGNFILLTLAAGNRNRAGIVDRLLNEDAIFVKDVSAKYSDGGTYLRLAVRTPEENGLLLSSLPRMLS
jgi:histidinol-phosphate/aromatic aminotransferase/cobyric acid decarboxylase-like protein